MPRRLHAVIAVLLGASIFLSLGADSCSGSSTLKREGEACTRTTECQTGLACSAGTCRPVSDGGPSDGGTDAAPGDSGP